MGSVERAAHALREGKQAAIESSREIVIVYAVEPLSDATLKARGPSVLTRQFLPRIFPAMPKTQAKRGFSLGRLLALQSGWRPAECPCPTSLMA
jgi:hypothetical protein